MSFSNHVRLHAYRPTIVSKTVIKHMVRAIATLVPAFIRHRFNGWRIYYQTLRVYGPEPRANALILLLRSIALPRRTILFYPELPDEYQVVYKLCLINGDRMISDLTAKFDVAHKHIKATSHESYDMLERIPHVINTGCRDISKAHVQKVFSAVFGYDLEVDPTQHVGPAVRKSDANYAHDGVVVDCPLVPDEHNGVVYQRFVDTENSDGYCVDHRVPIYGDQIPLVYLKYKPASDRFDAIVRADIVTPQNVFSEEERRQIIEFARAMGLDFGELDVLRDNTDGRIYIVDVNNTPAGPERGLTAEQKRYAVGVLADAYRRLVQHFAVQPARVTTQPVTSG